MLALSEHVVPHEACINAKHAVPLRGDFKKQSTVCEKSDLTSAIAIRCSRELFNAQNGADGLQRLEAWYMCLAVQ